MSAKKPWCAYSSDTACDCLEGECQALKMRGTIDALNLLIGYGLTLQEAADDIKEPRP